jgi:formylglycine-generating enzyme required for sulfatase activity
MEKTMDKKLFGLSMILVAWVCFFVVSFFTTTSKTEAQNQIFTNAIGMEFVLIHSGSFQMGSPTDEPKRGADERQHLVSITKPFYLQKIEVTQGQWKTIMGYNPSLFNKCGEDCPVEMVSWNEAREFIRKLNQTEKTGNYRLPTEAEWEFACRAGTTSAFNTGICITTDQANFNGKSSLPNCPPGKYRNKTIRTGAFMPNPWGLYDMHGNVWEWCQDWYGREYPKNQVRDPKRHSYNAISVLRGGSWKNGARFIRSASRRWEIPDFRSAAIGFRVARDLKFEKAPE